MGPRHTRNSTRVRKAHPPKKPRHKSARLKPSKVSAAKGPHASPTRFVREMRDRIPTRDLIEISYTLKLIQSCAQVVGHALIGQNCEIDRDAGRVLRRYIVDGLLDPIRSIDKLLKEAEA